MDWHQVDLLLLLSTVLVARRGPAVLDTPLLLLYVVQNEKSGAFLPSQDGARRLRDPRAMRNDYGRLPYHLAMRKGLTWLGEMLDPSVPVRCAAAAAELQHD